MSVNFTTYANNNTPFFITSQPEIIPANQTSGCNSGTFRILPYQPIQLPGIPNNTAISIATIPGTYSPTVGNSYRLAFTSFLSVIKTSAPITTGGNLVLTASVNGNILSATTLFINSNNYPDESQITFAKATYMPLVGDFVSTGSASPITLTLSNAIGVNITDGSIVSGWNSIFQVSNSNVSKSIFS
jgi:hypothetical protein